MGGGRPLTGAEREAMPDADPVWLTPLEEMLACLDRAGLVVRSQEDHSRSHQAVAQALCDAFVVEAPGVEELVASPRLWSEWLRDGRVRKLAFVAEKD